MHSLCEGTFFVIHWVIHTLFSCFALLQMGYCCLFHQRQHLYCKSSTQTEYCGVSGWNDRPFWCCLGSHLLGKDTAPCLYVWTVLKVLLCQKGGKLGRFWCLQCVTCPGWSAQRLLRALQLFVALAAGSVKLHLCGNSSAAESQPRSCLPFTW